MLRDSPHANISTFVYGMEVGWMSPTTKILQSESSPLGYALSDTALSLVASSTCFAGAFGVTIFSYSTDKFGRKLTVIAITIPQFISIILRIISPTLTALLIARILAGLVAGGCFIVVPIYVKEISQKNNSGILVSLQVLLQNVGLFIMFLMGIYVNYYNILLITSIFPILSLILFWYIAPESPAYLVKQKKIDEAYKAVALLRGLKRDDKNVENEITILKHSEEEQKLLPNMTLKDILSDKAWRNGVILALILFTAQALNGAFAIITYASPILSATGVEFDVAPEFQTLSLPVVMILASFLLTFIIERLGRKVILSVSFLISAVALTSLSISIFVRNFGGRVLSFLPVVAMMLSVAMYSGCICSVSYLVTTELFNFQVRGKLMGIVLSYAFMVFFIPLAVYSPITNMFGQHITFLFFGMMNIIGAFFSFFCLPETKGRSDEEIRNILWNRKKENSF
ncbi:unnamed protein product [Leptidea sinapis]|uniref:Major facilitator superfamily (MFS) profile domain-containing protein n=1 Tax=Leptidea sinapis TaxID=189913 RepID=A0A5E4QPD7_9NEOP|nr:unnamed protein product [Leptidea sinapis]